MATTFSKDYTIIKIGNKSFSLEEFKALEPGYTCDYRFEYFGPLGHWLSNGPDEDRVAGGTLELENRQIYIDRMLRGVYDSPNWKNLVDTLIGNIEILSILQTNILFPVLIARLQTLRDSGTAIDASEPLIALWNNHEYSFIEEQVDVLNSLAIANNVPLILSNAGVIRYSRVI
jgi:hypothetical protein